MNKALLRSFTAVWLASLASACVFLDVSEQQQKIADACTIEGSVKSARAEERHIIVVLLHRDKELNFSGTPWAIVDNGDIGVVGSRPANLLK